MRDAGVAGPRPVAAQAFELALDPPASGLVIGISHEGGTAATNRGARGVPGGRSADGRSSRCPTGRRARPSPTSSSTTDELDQSWCHTIGYVAPLLAATAVAAALRGEAADAAAIRAPHGGRRADTTSAEAMAATLADARHLIVIASGRGPDRRARADPQDRGGGLDPDRVPRPRDVPPRPPARRPTTRPGSCSSSPTATAATSASPVPARRSRRRGVVGVRRAAIVTADVVGRARSVADPGRPAGRAGDPGPAGGRGRAARFGDAAPAPDRADRPGPRDEPRPDPPRRPALRRGVRARRGLTRGLAPRPAPAAAPTSGRRAPCP